VAVMTATVLVVDDNDDVRELLQEFLEDAGFRVRAARDGEAAIQSFTREPSDLVITDMRMPKLNGLQVLQAVRAARPGTPVILLTGQGAAEGDADEARRLGVYACLTKPLTDIHLLPQLVAAALEQRAGSPTDT
jgi:DNA-binding NtrC family response regulator